MSGARELEPREAALRVAQALLAAGHEALFAGGCVRDRLLGMEPKDFDVATSATPDEVKAVFPKARGVGESFGVMLVRSGGLMVEVATFREDLAYTDGRRPDQVRFSDARTDAQRRDFTINGLFERPETGEIVDFVGGQADCAARVVRAIGDPHARIAEDRLRMLRAVRFAARLGFAIDPATESAVRSHARELASVSPERVGDELRRMMEHPSRALAAAALERTGLDGAVFGTQAGAGELGRLGRLPGVQPLSTAIAAWWLDRLARGSNATLPRPDEATRADFVARLRSALVLSNQETGALAAVLDRREELLGWDHAGGLAARVRLAARQGIDPALLILDAEDAPRGAEWRARLEAECPGRRLPEPLLDGHRLAAAGYRPGPLFRTWLDLALDAQIEGRIRSADEALALVRSLAGG